MNLVTWTTRLGTKGMKPIEDDAEAKKLFDELNALEAIEHAGIDKLNPDDAENFKKHLKSGDVIVKRSMYGETIRYSQDIADGDPLMTMTDVQLFKQYFENVEKLIVDATADVPHDPGVRRRLLVLKALIDGAIERDSWKLLELQAASKSEPAA